MRPAITLSALISILLFAVACEEEDPIGSRVNDRIELNAELMAPRGPVSAYFAVEPMLDSYVAAGELNVGIGRPEGASAVAYLTRPGTIIDTFLTSSNGCLSLSPSLPTTQFPLNASEGTFVLEIVTDQSGDADCHLSSSAIASAVRGASDELGTDPGQINFYLTGDFSPDTPFSVLYPLEYGSISLQEEDFTSAAFIGVPGVYLSFEITGGTLRDVATAEVYDITSLRGRVFFETR